MKNKNRGTFYLVQAALIAAVYAAVTFFVSPLSFGVQQFRLSEALTLLPVLTPAAIPGLTVGCFISNLSSPYGLADIICGTLATFLAALFTRLARKVRFKNQPLLSLSFPVLCNGIIVGAELSFFLPDGGGFISFLTIGLSVAFGEAVVCSVLGLPLLAGLSKAKIFKQ